jgi:hypothetical protein
LHLIKITLSCRSMPSSGMLLRVALVRTDILEELSASFIRVTTIGVLGKTLAVTSNRRTLRRTPKRRFLQEPHGVTSQKTSFFIVTGVKTSNQHYPVYNTVTDSYLATNERRVGNENKWHKAAIRTNNRINIVQGKRRNIEASTSDPHDRRLAHCGPFLPSLHSTRTDLGKGSIQVAS